MSTIPDSIKNGVDRVITSMKKQKKKKIKDFGQFPCLLLFNIQTNLIEVFFLNKNKKRKTKIKKMSLGKK